MISFYRTFNLDPQEAKSLITRKNIKYLVNRKFISELYIKELNQTGKIFRVIAENVQDKTEVFNEYHLVFDDKINQPMLFPVKDYFYGNIFDYIQQCEIKNAPSRNT